MSAEDELRDNPPINIQMPPAMVTTLESLSKALSASVTSSPGYQRLLEETAAAVTESYQRSVATQEAMRRWLAASASWEPQLPPQGELAPATDTKTETDTETATELAVEVQEAVADQNDALVSFMNAHAELLNEIARERRDQVEALARSDHWNTVLAWVAIGGLLTAIASVVVAIAK